MIRRVFDSPIAKASLLRILAVILSVASSITVARLGGPDVKGVSSAFIAASSLVFVGANFDLAQQVLRHAQQNQRLETVRATIVRLWLWYSALTALVIGLAVTFGFSTIAWVAVGALTYLMGTQLGYASNGISGPTTTAWGGVIQQGVLIVGTAFAWLIGSLDADSMRAVIVISFLVPIIYYWHTTRPSLGDLVRNAGQLQDSDSSTSVKPTTWYLLRTGSQWQIVRVCQFVLLRIDTIAVFAFLGARAAGVYSVGLATASLAGIIPSQFASNATYEATRGLEASLKKNVLQAGAIGLIAAAGLAAIGWPLIKFAYGTAFVDAYLVTILCLPGVIAFALLQLYTNRTRILGRARDVTIPSAIGALTMLVGLLFLPNWIGLPGAAISSSLGAIVAIVAAYFQFKVTSRTVNA